MNFRRSGQTPAILKKTFKETFKEAFKETFIYVISRADNTRFLTGS
jgi:hypothetical protein